VRVKNTALVASLNWFDSAIDASFCPRYPETAATMPLVSRHLMTRVKRQRELDMVDLALRFDGRNRCGFRSRRNDSFVQDWPGYPDRCSCTIPSVIVIASRQSRKAQPLLCANSDTVPISNWRELRRSATSCPETFASLQGRVRCRTEASDRCVVSNASPANGFREPFREMLSENWRLEDVSRPREIGSVEVRQR